MFTHSGHVCVHVCGHVRVSICGHVCVHVLLYAYEYGIYTYIETIQLSSQQVTHIW